MPHSFWDSMKPLHKKLLQLNLQIPSLPVMTIGSLPKQEELKELRYKVMKGVQAPDELFRKEKLSTELWVREQERLGLDVLVDAQMNRSDMISFYAKNIGGFFEGGTVRCYGNRYYKKPIITGKLEWKGPMGVEMWQYAQRLSRKPVKAVLTGPYTLMDWTFNEYYPSREEALADMLLIMKRELTAFIETGAKIIQIDEPALSARPSEISLVTDSLKELLKNFKGYAILHHSYGDLAPVWDKIQTLPVDNFSVHASALPLIKKRPTKKDVSIGVIDAHSHLIEDLATVKKRVQMALKVVPRDRLWITTDSGLKTRTIAEATGKLRAMAQAVGKLR